MKNKTHTIKTNKGEFVLVEISSNGINFFINMGYLIFKVPEYDNWVTDEDLSNPIKLQKYIDGVKDQWKQDMRKLPEGNFKFIAVTNSFVTNKHEASQNLIEEISSQIVDDKGKSGMDSFNRLLISENLQGKCYAILQKQN